VPSVASFPRANSLKLRAILRFWCRIFDPTAINFLTRQPTSQFTEDYTQPKPLNLKTTSLTASVNGLFSNGQPQVKIKLLSILRINISLRKMVLSSLISKESFLFLRFTWTTKTKWLPPLISHRVISLTTKAKKKCFSCQCSLSKLPKSRSLMPR